MNINKDTKIILIAAGVISISLVLISIYIFNNREIDSQTSNQTSETENSNSNEELETEEETNNTYQEDAVVDKTDLYIGEYQGETVLVSYVTDNDNGYENEYFATAPDGTRESINSNQSVIPGEVTINDLKNSVHIASYESISSIYQFIIDEENNKAYYTVSTRLLGDEDTLSTVFEELHSVDLSTFETELIAGTGEFFNDYPGSVYFYDVSGDIMFVEVYPCDACAPVFPDNYLYNIKTGNRQPVDLGEDYWDGIIPSVDYEFELNSEESRLYLYELDIETREQNGNYLYYNYPG